VNVDVGPKGVAYDSGRGEVYVANNGYSTVSVISDTSNTTIATITNILGPKGVAYDSGKGQIWVVTLSGVTVISDSNHQMVAAWALLEIRLMA